MCMLRLFFRGYPDPSVVLRWSASTVGTGSCSTQYSLVNSVQLLAERNWLVGIRSEMSGPQEWSSKWTFMKIATKKHKIPEKMHETESTFTWTILPPHTFTLFRDSCGGVMAHVFRLTLFTLTFNNRHVVYSRQRDGRNWPSTKRIRRDAIAINVRVCQTT